MAAAGWYSDPGGKPGRYRYWDGTSWSETTTDDPADPPPGAGSRRPRRDGERHRPGRTIGLALLVLVAVVVSSILIIRRTDDATSIGHNAAPESTHSGWDDSSPLSDPSASPSASPSEDSSGSPAASPSAAVRCPAGRPDQLSLHPNDDRVHGGRLSMPTVPGYSAPEPEYMLSWMDDTESVDQVTEPGWQSLFAVGEVPRTAGFDTPRDAAHASMACALANGWYLYLKSRKDIRDEAISIDGHPAWIITSEIRDDAPPPVSVEGDQLSFVVVDDGRSDAYSVWCGMVPLGDQQRLALNQRVLSELRVHG